MKMDMLSYLGASLDDRRAWFVGRYPILELLEKRLLEHGGKRLIYTPEIHFAAELMEQGKFCEASAFRVSEEQTPSACHALARHWWRMGHGEAFTGYALSEDGLWRAHSWCGQVVAGKPYRYLELTGIARTAYFGFQLNLLQIESLDRTSLDAS